MARDFLPIDRDQRFLLPPDMREWLPEDHLVWFLIAMVEQLDLSAFEANYQLGGVGRRAYHPAMLLTLLFYAYSQGLRSSRKMERACHQDIGYRVVCGTYGQTPDHTTICRFRQRHESEIAELFTQVLLACHELGMLPLGVIAVDGTKLAANASLGANRKAVAIRVEVATILAEAAAADEEDDARYGDNRGDEVPDDLVESNSRLARLRDALARARSETDRVNITDPDSRAMHDHGRYVQGYNAQVAVGEGQVIVAATVTNCHNDYGLLGPMLGAVATNLETIGVDGQPAVALADAGYFDTKDIAAIGDDPTDLLVATKKRRDQPAVVAGEDRHAEHAAEITAIDVEYATEQARRAALYTRYANHEISRAEALEEIGLKQAAFNEGYTKWRDGGVDAVPAPRRRTRIKRPSPKTAVRRAMESKLAQPENRAVYKQRGALVESVFGQLKEARGKRRFSRRGLPAVNSEFAFECTLHNLLKIRVALAALATGWG